MTEQEQKEKHKEVIRQESFWFTTTTATLIAVLTTLLKKPTLAAGIVALSLITSLAVFTIVLLVQRFNAYRVLNDKSSLRWCSALWEAIKEGGRGGTLYCLFVVLGSTIGAWIILLLRLLGCQQD